MLLVLLGLAYARESSLKFSWCLSLREMHIRMSIKLGCDTHTYTVILKFMVLVFPYVIG